MESYPEEAEAVLVVKDDNKLARRDAEASTVPMSLAVGWEVVCPDGVVRHYPYHNEGDARCDAEVLTRRGCSPDPLPGPGGIPHPPCSGGAHTYRLVAFVEPRADKRAVV